MVALEMMLAFLLYQRVVRRVLYGACIHEAKTASPECGQLVAMLFYNGSDACLAAGCSLMRQLLPHLHVRLASLATAEQNEEVAEMPDSRTDRGPIENILFDMDAAACLGCFWVGAQLHRNHTVICMVSDQCQDGHVKFEDALEAKGVRRNFASLSGYKAGECSAITRCHHCSWHGLSLCRSLAVSTDAAVQWSLQTRTTTRPCVAKISICV